MKFFFGTTAFLFVITLLSVQGGLSSCTKDKTIYDTVTLTRTDTLVIRDTLTIKDTVLTEDILTAHSWKLLECRGVVESSVIYYLRGGLANTESFDNEYITFNADHTGAIVDNAGVSHFMSNWNFSNPQNTKLVYTLFNDATIQSVYTWDNIRYKNGNIYYDHYFHDNLSGYDAHAQEIRSPK